jgi:tripartite-type tricarboxylate transporter receptor subunit TctC
MPDLATLHESGLPSFEVAVWHGMYAPKGTPKAIVDTLADALRVALNDQVVKQRFADLGTEPVTDSRARPEALRAHLKSEIDRWAPIITKAGAYAD